MTTRFLAGNHGVATPGSRVLPIVDRTLILYMRTHLEGRGPSVAGRGRDRPALVGRSWPLGAAVVGRLHRCLVAPFGVPFPVAARFWPPTTPVTMFSSM